jgi:hypothetical protein
MSIIAMKQAQRTMHAVGGVVATWHRQCFGSGQPWHEQAHAVR